MWFKNLIVFRLPRNWAVSADALEERLRPQAFAPVAGLAEASIGWAPPREDDLRLVYPLGRQLLLALRQEKKLLPAKVVSQVLKQRVERIEEAEGFKPGRKRLKELKEQVRDELLPRAFTLSSDTRVWIDPAEGWLVVDAASAAKADDVFSLLVKAIDGFPARPLRVAGEVSTTMTAWLSSDEAPAGFTIDQDAELKARGGKATIRYANQSLEHDDIVRHTRAGKQCTKLALTWAGRVSFVLTDRLEIRRVRALDVLKESGAAADAGAGVDERFESDMTLMTGELGRLLTDLVEALGGEAPGEEVPSEKAPSEKASAGKAPSGKR